ncbi:hypothetical protein F2Q70_00002502 [Brassica cretica]|uniref:Uncharacterized protein n=1 Tax=Brassica cretica TaxID=69181 RepID=A0A8S9IPQ3_BRACR|nr:hypothetical protein F2Q70_00002502 [Brassica cretica]
MRFDTRRLNETPTYRKSRYSCRSRINSTCSGIILGLCEVGSRTDGGDSQTSKLDSCLFVLDNAFLQHFDDHFVCACLEDLETRVDSIGSWADNGFHESFAVETVILSSNEDPTEEYDEDYWKERATEIAMQDERYSTHSFNNTPTSSIDSIYSASVDSHPHPAK